MSMSIMKILKGVVHVLEKIQKTSGTLHVILIGKSEKLEKSTTEKTAENLYVTNNRQIAKSPGEP